ncbi:choice-of-anchor R domain-containing protein [Candidatus Poriferisodalis sp.]|uniref:choice-of-anchor R domain-containing protein n=1 Tax=Candidatus Poriferisodalis sp. TaxID=3101277 RepID=UPI003B0136EF
MEVILGHSQDRSTGGSISVFSVDSRGVNRSHGEFWDHNRDDGRLFIEFSPGRDLGRWRTYYLELEARDGMQTQAIIDQFKLSRNYPATRVAATQYFGTYTVTATDITEWGKLVANTSRCFEDDDPFATAGHKLGQTAATERYAQIQDFTTGPNTGGYRLQRVEAYFSDLASLEDPKVELWDTAATPAKVADLAAPLFNTNLVVSPRNAVRFTSDGTRVLSASTTYRLVFSETKDTGDDFERYDIKLYPGGCSYQERDNAAGWSIATSYSQSKEGVATVTTGTPTGSSLRIGVYGNPVGGM